MKKTGQIGSAPTTGLSTNTPEQAQLLLIDPKGALDYAAVDRLPHLRQEIVTEPDSSIQAMTRLVQETTPGLIGSGTFGARDRTAKYIDPITGVLLQRVTAPSSIGVVRSKARRFVPGTTFSMY